MTETDEFMQEEFMPFYRRVLEAFKENHHTLYSTLSSFLGDRKNHIGMRITVNGSGVGDYTLHLVGANISHLENGVLASEIHTPFGVIKPYYILEKSTVEAIIKDEQNFIENPFGTKLKYFHDITIKFLK